MKQRNWRQREKAVLRMCGLTPVPLSGAGFHQKEDGKCLHFLAQVKGTEGKALSVKRLDLEQLVGHAREIGRYAIFLLDYGDRVWVAFQPEQLDDILHALSEHMQLCVERRQ